jgi:spore maturation protein CgeB
MTFAEPRRAVFATEFWHGATGSGLAHGFRKLGWLVDEVNLLAYATKGSNLSAKVESRLFRPVHIRAYNRAILDALAHTSPELLLTAKGSLIDPATIAQARRDSVRTVNYYPDFEFEFASYDRRLLQDYDLVVTTKSFHLPTLRAQLGPERVALVHHGYSSLVHRPIAPLPDEERDTDILYVGNASQYKLRWMLALAEAFPDRNIRVVGGNWARLAKGTALAKSIVGQPLHGDFYAHEIGRSRINIALHMGPATKSGWQDPVSTRTFEIPACGGFMLHIDNEEIRSFYDVPGEIDTFATPDELVAKVRHYLNLPEQRRAMAERAHRRAVPAYSYDARAQEIVELL